MSDIPEADWKVLRSLKDVALERLCERILAEVHAAASMPGRTNHQRYLDVYALVQKRDRAVADCFNDLRRSTATISLFHWRKHKLLTVDEWARFSDVTQAVLAVWDAND
jgi:hypothetical protein